MLLYEKRILFFSPFLRLFRHRVDFDLKEVKKVSIPFKLINNLVFIPINVNGVS
jgi:hypothetical protein